MSFRRLLSPKYVGIAATVIVGTEAVIIFSNDEWEERVYFFKKKFGMIECKEVPRKRKVVILGTGWAALSFIQHLDQDKIDLKVISPRPFFFYTPLLAGTTTGTVAHNSIIEPIRWYLKSSYIQAECTDVDIENKQVKCATLCGVTLNLPYDDLVIAIGGEPATFNIPGVKENSYFMKEIDDSVRFHNKFLNILERASALQSIGGSDQEIDRLLHLVIVGGGPTGVEVTAEFCDFIRNDLVRYFPELSNRLHITLIEATDRILGLFHENTASYAKSVLMDQGTTVVCNANVTKVNNDSVEINLLKPQLKLPYGTLAINQSTVVHTSVSDNYTGKIKIPCGAVLWTAGITTRSLVRRIMSRIGSDEQSSRAGLLVDKKFRVKGVSDGSIWAIGDCAVAGCGPTAQAAIQQGKYLGRLFRNTNLQSDLIEMTPEFCYHNKGALAYVGGSKAVAELKVLLWHHHPAPEEDEPILVDGVSAFAMWRTLYYTHLLSGRNRFQVFFDWVKAYLFGRDIASTTFEYVSTYQNDSKPPKA